MVQGKKTPQSRPILLQQFVVNNEV